MAEFPWLTTAALVPLVGALLVAVLPGEMRRLARPIGVAVSLVAFGVVLAAALRFDTAAAGTHQLTETYPWIPQLGVSYAVGVDGFGLVMLALVAVLVPVCLLASWSDAGDDPARVRTFVALVLLLETLVLGVFSARDVFLFYVLFEAMLLPMYFLIGTFGGPNARYAALKFLLFSLAGGLLMLAAVIGVFVAGPGGPQGFLTDGLTGLDLDPWTGRLLFAGFFIAFAIKAPLWPLHTWLPDATTAAPPGVAVLLVAVLDKVGTFGMLTLCLPLFPEASRWAAPAVVVLALVSIVYGALLAIGQSDLMRLIGYTSISHFGFIVLGTFVMTTTGHSGAMLYMLNHGFSTAALFLVAGMLVVRHAGRSQRIADYGGVQKAAPLLAGSFLLAGLSSLALPGLSSFVSEFLVIVGSFARYPAAGVIATTGVILAALYILLTYQRVFTGPVRAGLDRLPDLTAREAWVVAPLVALIVGLGFYPRPALDVLTPAAERTMQDVGATDPAPAASTAEGPGPVEGSQSDEGSGSVEGLELAEGNAP